MLLGNLRNVVLSQFRKKVLIDKLMWISHTTITLVRNNISGPRSGSAWVQNLQLLKLTGESKPGKIRILLSTGQGNQILT